MSTRCLPRKAARPERSAARRSVPSIWAMPSMVFAEAWACTRSMSTSHDAAGARNNAPMCGEGQSDGRSDG